VPENLWAIQLPISSASTLVSPTAFTPDKLNINGGGGVARSFRLTNRYPAAYKDFFGTPSGAPCIYKSGPAWPEPKGPQAQRYISEARPVYGHPIAGDWLKIGTVLTSTRPWMLSESSGPRSIPSPSPTPGTGCRFACC